MSSATLLPPRGDLLAHCGRAAHDLGLAALLGGQLFGRLALHPAVAAIGDERERGAVVNAAWRRYGAVNAVGLLTVTGGWAAARAGQAHDRHLVAPERRLARTKDVLVAATCLIGAATAAEGVRFARQAPGGAVPLTDGDRAAPAASDRARRLKRTLNALGVMAITTEAALVGVNAALEQTAWRRAPLRRRLRRRF